jgi:flagellar basal body rod protein FlgG
MPTFRGILTAARTLSHYARLQEVTANNLANVGTAGFKADRLVSHRAAGLDHPVPVPATDLSQGALRTTGRPLDVALEGAGFLVVETAAGERLIRGGALRLDGQGRLVDPEGSPVLGREGQVVLTGPTIEIRPDGTVVDDGREIDRLRVVRPDPGAELLKEAAGRFRAGPRGVSDAEDTLVRQGQLEDANLNAISAMIALVEIQRAYAANSSAVRALDGVLGSVTNEVGRVA